MEQYLGRELLDDETVDHKDDDFTNDDINNLQILTRIENSKKYTDKHPAKYISLTCKNCGIIFERREAVENYNKKVRLKNGHFCSHSCVGKVYH